MTRASGLRIPRHGNREAQIRLTSHCLPTVRSLAVVDYKPWSLALSFYERGLGSTDVLILPSHVWQNWNQFQELPKEGLTRSKHPFDSRFLAMPCNIRNKHWILLVIAHASDIVGLPTTPQNQPCAMYFDSFPTFLTTRSTCGSAPCSLTDRRGSGWVPKLFE